MARYSSSGRTSIKPHSERISIMNDSMARIIRSIAQLIAGVPVTALSDWLLDALSLNDRYAYPLAVLIVITAQNVIEELSGKALLKPNSPPAAKTVDPVANI